MESLISDERLVQIQAVTGLAFTSFLGLHLGNTFFAHSGPHGYDGVTEVLRQFYQHPVIEPLLLSSMAAHQVSSAILIVRRLKRVSSPPLAVKLHRYSSYVLGAVVAGHIYATRGHALLFGQAADFQLITFSLKHWPAVFYPYYIVFGSSGAYHLLYGVSQALYRLCGVSTSIKRGSRAFYTIAVLLSVGLASSLAAFGGLYFPVLLEKEAFLKRVYESQYPAWILPWKRV